MKLLAGETLADRLRRQPGLTPVELRVVLRQLCDGLAAIHAAGIAHRDLKPGNVMLVAEGQSLCVSIMDFGLARLHRPGPLSPSGQDHTVLAGTPGYLAPEMLHGDPPSAATNLYAFGILLQRLLGEPPSAIPHTSASSAPPTASRILSGAPSRTDSLSRSGLPTAITRPIADLLAPDPARRHQAFTQLQTALQAEKQPSLHSSLLLGVAFALTLIAVAGGILALLPGALNLGVALEQLNDPARLPLAEQALRHSLAINPTYAAWSDLGDIFMREDRCADAVAADRSALQLNSNNADVWNNLAEAQEGLHDDDGTASSRARALELYQAELKVDPRNFNAESQIAPLLARLERRDDALRAIHLSLHSPPAIRMFSFRSPRRFTSSASTPTRSKISTSRSITDSASPRPAPPPI